MLDWKSDTHLTVDGIDFALAPTRVRDGRSSAAEIGGLVLRKPRWMVEQYDALRSTLAPRRVVELGIHDGGSTALLALLFAPTRLVAADLTAARATALDDFVRDRKLGDIVHAYFGVDQSDRDRLDAIVTDEFGAEPLDLVVDDASHLLDESTASFNPLPPRAAGRRVVIEDWDWQHYRDEALGRALEANPAARAEIERRLAAGEVITPSRRVLSRLVLELVLTAAYTPDAVAEVTSVRSGWTVVRRGPAALDSETFDIRSCYGSLGRALLGEVD